jgi:hypothetical protein
MKIIAGKGLADGCRLAKPVVSVGRLNQQSGLAHASTLIYTFVFKAS